MTSTEYVVSNTPLVIRRRAKWGDCDPAGVVYTVTFSEYVISAAELFYGALFATTPQRAKREQGFGTPTRSLAFEFHRSLRPDDEFDMRVTVTEILERSYVLQIEGRTPEGEMVFLAKLTPICVARSERKSIAIPDVLRLALENYCTACERDQNPGTPS